MAFALPDEKTKRHLYGRQKGFTLSEISPALLTRPPGRIPLGGLAAKRSQLELRGP
jgi:hypothetical protein